MIIPPTIFGLPTLIFIIFTISFIAGLATIPLLAYTIGPSLPSFISEPLSNIILMITGVGVGTQSLSQEQTDEYVLRRESSDLKPKKYWRSWALSTFGITFEKTPEAFGSLAVSNEKRIELENLEGDLAVNLASADLDRGDKNWYVDLKRDLAADILVPIGQRLSELQPASGPDVSAVEPWIESVKDHGGDTSDFSQRTFLMGLAFFTIMGMGVGFVMFT